MKKSIVFLMCLIAVLMLGTLCAYAGDTDDGALTVTITAADGLEVPQEGLAVTVYAGNLLSGGAANVIEWEPSYCYSYEHYARANGKETNWITTHHLRELYNETVYIDPVTRSATATIYPKSKVSRIAYYVQPSSGYIGSGGKSISISATTAEMTISYVKAVTLSGTITVPAADKDIDYDINIIGDVSEKPEIEYDYTFKENDTLKAGKTEINYSVYVRPDMDYDVYVDFDDIYKVEHKTIHIGQTDAELDFTAEKANKITGVIKLPDSFTSIETVNGDTEDEIQLYIYLQDAEAPHDIIDHCGVLLSPDNRSSIFELCNITDAENVIVYYEVSFPGDITGLCTGAAYMNNQKCTLNKNDAARLGSDSSPITINIIPGQIVKLSVESQSPSIQDFTYGNLRAILSDGSYVTGLKTNGNYYITLPADCDKYILNLADGGDLRGVYYTESGFTRNISEADPISASETEKTVTLDRYEPDIPVTYIVSQRESNPNIYEVNYTNQSDFDIENVIVYTYTKYLDGEVLIERDRPQKLWASSNVHTEIANTSNINKMYMFIWDENMRPLAEDKIVVIDRTEEE